MSNESTNQDMSLPRAEGSEPALRTLAERLLHIPFPDMSETADEIHLLVEQLPEQLPVEIPIADGSRIVGSLVRGRYSVTIVLDSDRTPVQVLDFYRERMQAAGWAVPEMPMHGGGGFMPAFFANRIMFCRGARGPALNVSADAEPGKPTDVRLDVQLDPRHSPCGQRHHMGMHEMIPALAPPPNARVMPQGGGGGGDSWHSNALVETDLDLAAVAGHYARQLEQASWTRGDEGQSGPAAWSTWTLRDEENEPWRGLLLILERPDSARGYFLFIRVESATNDSTQGGASWVGHIGGTYTTLRRR